MQKLIEQFDFEVENPENSSLPTQEVSDERATLLFLIDTYNKHLLEIESHPVRKVRETLDNFAKELLQPGKPNADRVLFRFRQFFSSYRIDEYAYMQKTFEEFRSILWDFVEQLGEDINYEKNADREVLENLVELKEAVEANSIDDLRTQSRQFIDFYTEYQVRKDEHRNERLENIKRNLTTVKKQLSEANNSARLDHLTSAHNRKSFDEHAQQQWNFFQISKSSTSMIILDIDHFKRVNDTYGHATGDYVIQECVNVLQKHFSRENDFVARIGGEEFAVILSETSMDKAFTIAEEARKQIQGDTLVHEGVEIRFTVSMGISQLKEGKDVTHWMKEADEALYESKHTGRNRITMWSEDMKTVEKVA